MEVGIDIQRIDAFKDFEENRAFYEKVFSKAEIEYCMKKKDYKSCFCGKFCAKEAIMKTLNQDTLIGDIEILNMPSGKPYVKIKSVEKDIKISLSHSKDSCVGVAVNNEE